MADDIPPSTFVVLFVHDPATSAAFYRRLLDREPLESSPTFAMFALANGVRLGLWSSTTAEPRVIGTPGASELCFVDPNVDATHADWLARGAPIAQAATDMDFGRTFVALDPDGHRLRVFWPAEAA